MTEISVTTILAVAITVIFALIIAWIVSAAAARERYRESLAELRASRQQAIDAARSALALENEMALKAREESLKKEAAETMKIITSGLDRDIRDMKEAFEAQKKTQAEESSSIKTSFEQTVRNLREQTESIGAKADNLASALKGKNKMQGIFGETVLENILKAEGLSRGRDYDAEFALRDASGALFENEESHRTMRPDFALHFPEGTDVLIDSKVSLSALADYFDADDEEGKADAARRNLESVREHVRELSSKEYQRYVTGRKTLDYVIMFIPNYGAYQLARESDPDIFVRAFSHNVLITTEETLIPFLRLIRTAWVRKEQMENIGEIVEGARRMIDRVALFCDENARIQRQLESLLEDFKANTQRLSGGRQSIVKAAWDVASHGITPQKRQLPPLDPPIQFESADQENVQQ